jgi:vacuolar-type H+-ATPase subunit H
MEDTLKKLLEAEARAQASVDAADRERERLIAEALGEAREAEARFEADKADIRAPYLREAEARAEQGVAELTRKYKERQHALRVLADKHEAEAVGAALELLLDPRY